MLHRALQKDSCNEIIELALKVPETQVVAFGPESCLRVLFFRAARKNLLDRFNMVCTEAADIVTNSHLEILKDGLEEIIRESKKPIKAFIVYISCVDILIGTNFTSITRNVENKYNIPVKIFQRGPLSRRRMLPKDRLGLIFAELDEYYQGQEYGAEHYANAVNILGEEKILPDSNLANIIKKAGYTQIIDFSSLKSFEEFLLLRKSNKNIVTHKFALSFAEYLRKRYGIPYIYLPQSRNREERKRNYHQLAEFLQVEDDFSKIEQDFHNFLNKMPRQVLNKKIAVGVLEEALKISRALLELGFDVRVIFLESISAEEKKELVKLCRQNRDIKIFLYSKLPVVSVISENIDVAVGQYAVKLFPQAKPVDFKEHYDMAFENIKTLIGEII